MDDKEKILNFGDMVNAADKLAAPWRKALIITNVLWAIVLTVFIAFAYLAPETTYQHQNIGDDVKRRAAVRRLSRRVTKNGVTNTSPQKRCKTTQKDEKTRPSSPQKAN